MKKTRLMKMVSFLYTYCIVETRRVDSRRREREREKEREKEKKREREKSGKSLIFAKIFAARGRGGVASIYDPPKSRPSSPRGWPLFCPSTPFALLKLTSPRKFHYKCRGSRRGDKAAPTCPRRALHCGLLKYRPWISLVPSRPVPSFCSGTDFSTT